MYSVITTATVRAMDVRFVCVEADVSDGMPYFEMVGFLSSEVKEAKERVRTAMKNSGCALPPRRITVNLSPVNLRKVGNIYDLPVAIAIMTSMEIVRARDLEDFIVVGEIGLDGQVRRADGILPIVCAAAEAGIKECIVPAANMREAMNVGGVRIVGVSSVTEARDYLNSSREKRDEWIRKTMVKMPEAAAESHSGEQCAGQPDFADIHGQYMVKRACEVAVAGMHNFLMIGPPGSGKTMIASRIPGILPLPDFSERMEISKIYSIAGELGSDEGLIVNRPFRSPHHTISVQGMVGGGAIPKPGEITMSHGGVLFLDELPEFKKCVLETLRQPLEDRRVSIVRATGRFEYPADFMLVCAMNPCSCGYYPDRNRCNCSVAQVSAYLRKISRPLLDRIDISVEAPRVTYKDLEGKGPAGETSARIRERVTAAQAIQKERYKDMGIRFNSQLTGMNVERMCGLDEAKKRHMSEIFEKMNLTARGYYKILKVARTIADLDGREKVELDDLNEAVMYKGIDEKFFGEVV
ncbi:MAG: YifB family Mg chelatase-like AAA ATPase [Eubacterium sp.]|nr:YifB family Mg chelatase-like AAA ATPase [Eubacterium sp.]